MFEPIEIIIGVVVRGNGLGHGVSHGLVQDGGDDELGGQLVLGNQSGQSLGGADLHALGDVGGVRRHTLWCGGQYWS